MLLKHAVDGGAGDKMAFCQLAETVTTLAVPQDSVAIKNKWFSPDVTAFELGPPHAGAAILSPTGERSIPGAG